MGMNRERAPGRTSISVLSISLRIAYPYKPTQPDSTIRSKEPNASRDELLRAQTQDDDHVPFPRKDWTQSHHRPSRTAIADR